jgi:hypothetical protein
MTYLIEPGSELDKALDEMVESLAGGPPMDPERAKLINRDEPAVIKALGLRGLRLIPGAAVDKSVSVEATWYGGLADA